MATLSRPGTSLDASVLDAPPPSPAVEYGMSPGPSPSGPPTAGGLGSLVGGVTAQGLPPDVLTGMMQTGAKMSDALDAFAQMAPDVAPDVAVVKQALSALMAKLVQAGAGPTSPTAPGTQFPGGGFAQGGMPLA